MHPLFQKAFLEMAYGVAIRPRTGDPKAPFFTKFPSIFRWYADPFVVEDGERTFVFVELLDYHYGWGRIAAAPVKNGRIGSFRVVLREPFHMSFPNVFRWRDAYYMIPETSQAGEVRLYRGAEFPWRWELDTVLVEDVRLVDHATWLEGDCLRFISMDIGENRNRVFETDLASKTTRELFPQGEVSPERGAGACFREGETLYRPVQDCTNCYGDFLRFLRLDAFTPEELREREVCQLHGEDLVWDDNRGNIRVHTYNRSRHYEVVDFQYRKFYPNKLTMRLWQRVILRGRQG